MNDTCRGSRILNRLRERERAGEKRLRPGEHQGDAAFDADVGLDGGGG